MFNYDDIPDWIQHVEPEPLNTDPIWTLHKVRDVISKLNFLKGSYIGFAMKIDELEKKFAMALEYQREVDAQLLEKYDAPLWAEVIRRGN